MDTLIKVLSESEEIIKTNNIYLLTDAVICYPRQHLKFYYYRCENRSIICQSAAAA
jgi:hypothetical protein